jgi:hypothetical protein
MDNVKGYSCNQNEMDLSICCIDGGIQRISTVKGFSCREGRKSYGNELNGRQGKNLLVRR